jgi:alpha-L-arabinofuranosidase
LNVINVNSILGRSAINLRILGLTRSAFAMGVSTINFNGTESSFNTTGLMFKVYWNHFGTVSVEVNGNSPQPAPKWPVGGEQPATSPGSPTYPRDMPAAFTSDRKFQTAAIVNATEEAQSLNLYLAGVQLAGEGNRWEITGPPPDAANALDKPSEVEFKENVLSSVPETLSVAPATITFRRFSSTSVNAAVPRVKNRPLSKCCASSRQIGKA